MARTQRAQGTASNAQPAARSAAPATPPQERIAARAYEIWRESGCPDGKQLEHWLAAERELRGQAKRTDRS